MNMNDLEKAVLALATQKHKNQKDKDGLVFGDTTLPSNLYHFLQANGNSPDATDFLQYFCEYGQVQGKEPVASFHESSLHLLAQKFQESVGERKDDYSQLGVLPDKFDQVLAEFSQMLPTGIIQSPYAMMNGFHNKLGLSQTQANEALTLYASGSFTVANDHPAVSLLDEMCKNSELAGEMVSFTNHHLDTHAFDAVGKYVLPDNDSILKDFLFAVSQDGELLENPLKTIEDGILEHLCGNVEKAFEVHIETQKFEKDGQVLSGLEVLEQYDDFQPDMSVGADGGIIVNDRELHTLDGILSGLKGQFCSQMEVEPHFVPTQPDNKPQPC